MVQFQDFLEEELRTTTRNTRYGCILGLTIFVYLFITYKNSFIPGSIVVNGILTHYDNNNVYLKYYDIIVNCIFVYIANSNILCYKKLIFSVLGIIGFFINNHILNKYIGHNKFYHDIGHVLLCQLPLAVALSYYLHETYC